MRLWYPQASSWSAIAGALAYLVTPAADAQEASKVEVPATQNPYISVIAILYEQSRQEEALSKIEKALEWKSNGPQEMIWLKLMKGVLQAELGQDSDLEPFKAALALDAKAQLPVKGSWRLRKLFEQARNTAGLPANKVPLAKKLEPVPLAKKLEPVPRSEFSAPPTKSSGVSVSVRGEVDLLGLRATPAVSLGYHRGKQKGVLTLLVQASPGLRAEGQLHLFTLGWAQPYARVGATAFFFEKDMQGNRNTFVGGISGRIALGVDLQWNSRMFSFADVAYERFLPGEARYKSQSLLFAVGVGLFP